MLSIPSKQLIKEIEISEVNYMYDRMLAIQSRMNNPEGIEVKQFGNSIALYSKTMPWATFNTVKGITSADIEFIDPIIEFYRTRDRKAQFEIIPSLIDQNYLKNLSDRGFYQSGFHSSLYIEPRVFKNDYSKNIRIQELKEDQFIQYAIIHCRGTGLSDDGIPYVAENNKVLYNRPGWKFFIAYMNGTPAAVGVMHMKDGIASLTFAATLPEFRNQGLQQRLIEKRIEESLQNNCKLVVGQCAFLSQSHRNMERIGMKIGYIRTSWTEI
ncbi:GNAT family N-acetyltransferase [Paenibacillus glacialis]|uniref:GCN5 family acetyltransferase n=1 Tax=Paenibacillus glacialis TaxID=494026 RepID=A0A168MKA6_9BACL|nr:GNAT family N-acetyltransferase [Paenibacillus glacialis]OAB44779.1 GCN5 family acetyltransferase [Paenibacillus glacialis]